jgi:hypothetical protein
MSKNGGRPRPIQRPPSFSKTMAQLAKSFAPYIPDVVWPYLNQLSTHVLEPLRQQSNKLFAKQEPWEIILTYASNSLWFVVVRCALVIRPVRWFLYRCFVAYSVASWIFSVLCDIVAQGMGHYLNTCIYQSN